MCTESLVAEAMLVNVCLLTCALALGQQTERAEWSLLPRFPQGLELVYSGWYTEETLQPGLLFQRKYRLDTHIFVLNTTNQGAEVAILTVLTPGKAPEGGDRVAVPRPSSVRLELAEVDRQGRIRSPRGDPLLLPLFDPPTLELGSFLVVPLVKVSARHSWETAEDGRPPRIYEVQGTVVFQNTLCVKVAGVQKSPDWERPRADSTAWERKDLILFSPLAGYTYQVERVILRRDPARQQPTHRYTVRYELGDRPTFPGKLYENRRQEIQQACKFQQEAQQYMQQPTLYGNQIDLLLRRIGRHLEQHSPTPYRLAVEQIKHRLEAARRGEVIAVQPSPPPPEPATLMPGQRVPDCVVTELVTRQSVRLHRLLGRPMVVAFYNPHTSTGVHVLRFLQGVQEKHATAVTILALAVSEDVNLVRQQHTEMKLAFPILDGRGLHKTFDVQATPRLIVLDAEGVMRAGYTGWGAQTAGEVLEELRRCQPKGSP